MRILAYILLIVASMAPIVAYSAETTLPVKARIISFDDWQEIKVMAHVVDGVIDTATPQIEPEALQEMQAVSELEPAAGDVTESDTVYVDMPEDCPVGYVCQIENYE